MAAEGKLFVGQVPAVCTEAMLRPLFAPYGTLVEIKIMRDPNTGRSRGCAWVRYSTRAEAQLAIDSLDGQHTIPPHSSCLQVRFADQQQAPQHRGGGNNNMMMMMRGGNMDNGGHNGRQQHWAQPSSSSQHMGGGGGGSAFTPNPMSAPFVGSNQQFGAGSSSPLHKDHHGDGGSNNKPCGPSDTLFFGNLPMELNPQQFEHFVRDQCAKHGLPEAINIRPPLPGKRYGFGVWSTMDEAATVQQRLHNLPVFSTTITVEYATPRRAPFQASGHVQHQGMLGNNNAPPPSYNNVQHSAHHHFQQPHNSQ